MQSCREQCVLRDRCAEVYGRMYNTSALAVTLAGSPFAISFDSANPIKNLDFVPGSFRILEPGVYNISYTLAFATNNFARSNVEADEESLPETVEASDVASALSPLVNADIIAGVLLNGVDLPATETFASNICCTSFIMQGGTIVELTTNTVISLAVWAGCTFCSGNDLILLPNSQLITNRIGNI